RDWSSDVCSSDLRPPLANPSVSGLYAAARVIDVADPSRLAHGVRVDTWNCGTTWVWPIGCDPEEPEPNPKGSERHPISEPFTGIVVGADDDSGAVVPVGEAGQRAQQLLRLQESVRVEEQIVDKLLAAAGAPAEVVGLVAAVGALEQAIAPYGFPGVIHAPAHLAAALQSAHLITERGGQRVSPLGHRWAFG